MSERTDQRSVFPLIEDDGYPPPGFTADRYGDHVTDDLGPRGRAVDPDGLDATSLDRRRWTRQTALTEFLDGLSSGPEEKLLAVFDWLALGHAKPGFRGCPFTNAAVEITDPNHPVRAVILAYKNWLRMTLSGLAAEAGLPDPEELGSDLLLLIDGANARVLISGDHDAMRSKVIRFCHQMENAATGEVSAITVLTGVHIDTVERRSCNLPEEYVARARDLIVGFDPGI
ncbi:hypothetical protein [Streptomyces sp. NPDC097640]|uniref:TetR family transcriptional regulator C-terminal domain-containing protein n=1 Tax=Streptomyces sp. NPDC097640 TaxID=3157229 RepID=UPI00331F27B1